MEMVGSVRDSNLTRFAGVRARRRNPDGNEVKGRTCEGNGGSEGLTSRRIGFNLNNLAMNGPILPPSLPPSPRSSTRTIGYSNSIADQC